MNCSEIRPQLEAYALDALDPRVRAQVAAHLETCAMCRREADALRDVTAELPMVLAHVSPLRPPAALKARLLDAVQVQENAHAQTAARQDSILPHSIAPHAEIAAPFAQRGHWLLNPRTWMVSLGTAMLVIVILAAWTLASNAQMQQARLNAQAAQEKVNQLQEQQALAVPVLNSLTAQEIVLTSPDAASATHGKVVLDRTKPTVVFIGYNLPELTGDFEYVLWSIDRGTMQARGSFVPNRDGFAMVVFLADRSDPLLKEILVTRQMKTDLMPSPDRVLVWRADPNDLSDDFSTGFFTPRPTVSRVGQ
jgi:anti-sigma factor RsiW